jgi:hypothetical protein
MFPMRPYARAVAAVGSCIGWFALLLQLYLMLIRAPADGATRLGALITFLSFFTILTNLLVALVFTAVGFHTTWGAFFRRPSVQAATVVYITVVGAVYWLLLKHLWNPQGAQWVADTLLHTWQPVAFVLYWFLFAPKQGLTWNAAARWLSYPLAYVLYTLLRGALTNLYPYPFIDVTQLGYARALAHTGLLLLVFLALGLGVVAAARKLDRS